jgi:Flp pilus assembly pilin Flp
MELQGSKDMLAAVAQGEAGQGLVEYALLILLISIASIVALGLLGTSVSEFFDTVGGAFP